jgi:hypothetical protein
MDRHTLRDVAMSFTIHAEQRRGLIECECATAAEAVSKAWNLMGAGATGLYIYDDELDETFWPNKFVELHKMSILEGALPETRDRC